jgi:hypothetical protein
MILITTTAATTYGWVEGYVLNASLGDQSKLPYIFLGHFTAYQVAVGLLLGSITGGFALIKSTQMFAKGNRYFLFACAGNWPFSWLVEDFTYFLFNPLDTIHEHHWTLWLLGGTYAYTPWLPGSPKPEFLIPNWYFLAFAWFLVCQWYAHRCTVYDNLLKDQVAQRILKPKPHPPMKEEHAPESPTRVPGTVPAPKPSPTPKTPVVEQKPPRVDQTPRPKVRSADAEAALERLRKRWLRTNGAQTGE